MTFPTSSEMSFRPDDLERLLETGGHQQEPPMTSRQRSQKNLQTSGGAFRGNVTRPRIQEGTRLGWRGDGRLAGNTAKQLKMSVPMLTAGPNAPQGWRTLSCCTIRSYMAHYLAYASNHQRSGSWLHH